MASPRMPPRRVVDSAATLQNTALERDDERRAGHGAECHTLRDFVQQDGHCHGQADAALRRILHGGQAPAIEESVQHEGADERRGESVQHGIAGFMGMVVRAGGADRGDKAVDQEEQAVAAHEEHTSHRPADLRDQFRQEPEEHYAQQDTGAERNDEAGAASGGGQPEAQKTPATPIRAARRRRSDSGGEPGGQVSTLAQGKAGRRGSGDPLQA